MTQLAPTTTPAHLPDDDLVRGAGQASLAGGLLGAASLVGVLVGETTQGADFMATGAAELAGWAGFASACLLLLGLVGLAVRHGTALGRGGRAALAVAVLAGSVVTASASTLALMVPDLAVRAPEVTTDPPVAVPASFILGGLVLGVAGLVLANRFRRAAVAPRWSTTLFSVASVVAILPLPSRYFLLALAVGAVLVATAREETGA
ncbi:hypothetical protein [Nocardioides solisilvae]|uniref:hypothetical protein n=1 Tax=Nocardioides solisilvae TaxID=1542435 RepID=UPI000D745573|nr:hypothetical protein [Nocardioides solisilvae]